MATEPDTDHIEVFYIDDATGWALASFDAAGNQLGDAEFAFHRKDLVDFARANLGEYELRVFKKNGERAITYPVA